MRFNLVVPRCSEGLVLLKACTRLPLSLRLWSYVLMTRNIEIATTAWCWEQLGPAEVLCRQAETAEKMGFHSFWLPENHFGERSAIPSPLMLLAAISGRTQRMLLGCTSYLLPIRHPLLAAEEVAVLDQLCGGRLILGLGRGVQPAMFAALGVEVEDKRKLFGDHLDLMRSAWRGDPVAHDKQGEPVYLSPLPLQRPAPPLWVAAFGPLALQQVASLGLPYLASPLESIDTLQQNYDRYRQLVAEAGLPQVVTTPVMRTVFVTKSTRLSDELRRAITKQLPAPMRDKAGELDNWAIVGDAQYVRDKLDEYQDRLGITHLIVRAGISAVGEQEQLRSHECLLRTVGAR